MGEQGYYNPHRNQHDWTIRLGNPESWTDIYPHFCSGRCLQLLLYPALLDESQRHSQALTMRGLGGPTLRPLLLVPASASGGCTTDQNYAWLGTNQSPIVPKVSFLLESVGPVFVRLSILP